MTKENLTMFLMTVNQEQISAIIAGKIKKEGYRKPSTGSVITMQSLRSWKKMVAVTNVHIISFKDKFIKRKKSWICLRNRMFETCDDLLIIYYLC